MLLEPNKYDLNSLTYYKRKQMKLPTLGRWQQDKYNKKEIISVKGWNEEATYTVVCVCENEADAAFIVEMYKKINPN